eukprot:6174377-Pleurochrysis_carterae.AAC.1
MRASRLYTLPEFSEGVGVGVGVECSELVHAAAAGAMGVSVAGIGVPSPNGRSSACKSLSGTCGRRLLLDWICASCSCIAKVARIASHKMRYARSQPAGAPSRAKCAGHALSRQGGWRRLMSDFIASLAQYPAP